MRKTLGTEINNGTGAIELARRDDFWDRGCFVLAFIPKAKEFVT